MKTKETEEESDQTTEEETDQTTEEETIGNKRRKI
jgi:hypothetical protein